MQSYGGIATRNATISITTTVVTIFWFNELKNIFFPRCVQTFFLGSTCCICFIPSFESTKSLYFLDLHYIRIQKKNTKNTFGPRLKSQGKIRTSRLAQKMGVLRKKISVYDLLHDTHPTLLEAPGVFGRLQGQ